MFITSNKWMRAGYGETTRKFLAEKTNPLQLIDFSGQKVFDAATVDVNILLFSKQKNAGETAACVVKEKRTDNLSDYIKQHNVNTNFKNYGPDSWVILSDIEQRIKEKIERVGIPLKDWDINIYRGVLTGYNEAFIVDGKKRDEILKNCKTEEERLKTAEILRPILRGRDIKRYGYEFSDLYLLFIPWHFPLHNDPTIIGASEKAEKEFKNQYPEIYNYLLRYKVELSNRNKAETGIRYEWYALQRWGANYWEVFSKQKIVWGEISDKTKFCIDLNGEYVCEATTFLMTGKNLLFLLCYLNSSLSEYLFSLIGTTTGVGTVRWKKFKIEQLPVPSNLQKEDYYYFESLAKKMINSINSEREMLEKKINDKIYQIFSLSKEEISLIEKSIFTRFV